MSKTDSYDPVPLIAEELGLPREGVSAVAALLDEGGTVPFIARYRKEATGGLDEVQIRAIQERRELPRRAGAAAGGDPRLDRRAGQADRRAARDRSWPARPRRRSRTSTCPTSPSGAPAPPSPGSGGWSRWRLRILEQPPAGDPRREPRAFVDAGKRGAGRGEARWPARATSWPRAVAEHADGARPWCARALGQRGAAGGRRCTPRRRDERDQVRAVLRLPGARRGGSPPTATWRCGAASGRRCSRVELEVERGSAASERIERACRRCRPASPFAEELRQAVRGRLPAPAGARGGEGDPRRAEGALGRRRRWRSSPATCATCCWPRRWGRGRWSASTRACAPAASAPRWTRPASSWSYDHHVHSARARAPRSGRGRSWWRCIEQHAPFAVAVGNGTGGRETEAFVRETARGEQSCKRRWSWCRSTRPAPASTAPRTSRARSSRSLDLTVRGAISIARRLQDPLAELVKIDPKAIGVGQYQHDVHQPLLQRKLDEVVESCVNQVGVELNTASAPLLSRVAGIGPRLAKKIVGPPRGAGAPSASRKQLLEGARARARGPSSRPPGSCASGSGEHPLDGSAVHPERYELVERMARDLERRAGRSGGRRRAGGPHRHRPLHRRGRRASPPCGTSSRSCASPAAIRARASSRPGSART